MKEALNRSKEVPLNRYAEWKIGPTDRRLMYLRFLKHVRRLTLVAWSLILLCCGGFIAGQVLPDPLNDLVVFLSQFLTALTFMVVSAEIKRRTEPDLLTLIPDPMPEYHFPMRLMLRVDGFDYGEDEGVIALGDGWLHFEGNCCTFDLRRDEIRRQMRSHPGNDEPLNIKLGRVTIQLSPFEEIRSGKRKWDGFKDELKRCFAAWIVQPGKVEGVSLLPPITPSPTFFPYRRFLAGTTVGITGITCLVLISILSILSRMKIAFALFVMIGLYLGVSYVVWMI